MAGQLDGTSSVSILYICKDNAAVAALKQFFECHMEFMKNKCEKEGPRKLLHYTISQSPESEGEGTAEAISGEAIRSTGRTIFHLFEIYETVDCLNHHWKEASQFIPAFQQLLEVHDIEIRNYTHMNVIQSL